MVVEVRQQRRQMQRQQPQRLLRQPHRVERVQLPQLARPQLALPQPGEPVVEPEHLLVAHLLQPQPAVEDVDVVEQPQHRPVLLSSIRRKTRCSPMEAIASTR